MYREQVNGVPKVNHGFLLNEEHCTWEEAEVRKLELEQEAHKHNRGMFTYEITGVSGSCRIIERKTIPEPSDYIKRK